METSECIKTRYSCRDYKTDPIPEETIKDLIELAVQAPNSGNAQDWEFIIVREGDTKRALYEATMEQKKLLEAPVSIVICSNLDIISAKYGARGANLYSVQNCAAAAENLMLAAWDKGIGSCWVGAFNENEIKRALYLPVNIRPLAIITIGYPSTKGEKKERKDTQAIIHRENFGRRL